jgi:hypothetical protein
VIESLLVSSAPSATLRPPGPDAAGVQLREGDHGERDQDDGRADGPADLQPRVAVDLNRNPALALAKAHERVQQRALDADEHHDRDIQRDVVEVRDLVRVWRATRLGCDEVREGVRRKDRRRHERRRAHERQVA